MASQLIENHGIIGDLNTVALVSLDGTIDFMCFPHFDSPTVFAGLLDDEKGGQFSITPGYASVKHKQLYLPDTNVLLTRFLSAEGVSEITDFMPVEVMFDGKELVRRVTNIRGQTTFRMRCAPRFDYARSGHEIQLTGDCQVLFRSRGPEKLVLRLTASVPLRVEQGDIVAEFTLKDKETADFLLEHVNKDHSGDKRDFVTFITESLFTTINYWKRWVDQCRYDGRWREMVCRSALVLKLLTSFRHGSIVAAATFGLPENVGGKRNWDYRFSWIRDASFTVNTLMRLGYTKEAGAFMNWVEKLCKDVRTHTRLGVMYSIDGSAPSAERQLDHLKGYRCSQPVRIGNDAYNQLQLDIYGELVNAVYLYNKYGEFISFDLWQDLVEQIRWLSENWQQPDEGIWEVRGGRQQFLYSRLQSWVAFDRIIKIAENRSFPMDPHWHGIRDEIYMSIYRDFWNEELQAFVQHKGSVSVDAATLLMPMLGFISPKDPRWLSTLERIEKSLVSDSLVYRYNPALAAPDGFTSREGTFSMCTFWYVECLSRSGQLQKARLYFEKMLGYANHLGLYGEQLGFEGDQLGNFPQAFTHLGLISAAFNLDLQLNDMRNKNVSTGEGGSFIP